LDEKEVRESGDGTGAVQEEVEAEVEEGLAIMGKAIDLWIEVRARLASWTRHCVVDLRAGSALGSTRGCVAATRCPWRTGRRLRV
jgi:hypothetical protein